MSTKKYSFLWFWVWTLLVLPCTYGGNAYGPFTVSTIPNHPATVYGSIADRTVTVTTKDSDDEYVGEGNDFIVAELFTNNASCDTSLYTYSCLVSCSPISSPNNVSSSCLSSSFIDTPSGPHWVDAFVTDLGTGNYTVTYSPEAVDTYDLSIMVASAGGLRGKYYDNIWFVDDPVLERIDSTIDFQWGTSVITEYGVDYVSVRWEGKLKTDFTETFTIYAFADDGVRLWLDRRLIIDKWDSCCQESWANVDLSSGHFHDILIDYKELLGSATIELRWSSPSTTKQIIPAINLYSLEHISESPFEGIFIGPGDPASSVTTSATGVGLTNTLAGEYTSIIVLARDIFGNDQIEESVGDILELEVMNSSNTIAYSSAFIGNGTYEILYQINITGVYNVSIRLNNEDIVNSPTILHIAPAETFVNESLVWGLGLSTGTTGVTSTFVIQAKDMFGNNRSSSGDDVQIALSGTNAPPAEVIYIENGAYQVYFTPTKNASIIVEVRFGSESLPGSPFLANINVGVAHAPSCTASSSSSSSNALTTPIAGDVASITLIARDEFGNQLSSGGVGTFTLQLIGRETLSHTSLTDNADGVYIITYTPKIIGRYTMMIELDDINISHSPFDVLVVAGDAVAATSIARGAALYNAIAGHTHTVLVETRDAYNNTVTSHHDDDDGIVLAGTIDCGTDNISSTYSDDGFYTLTYYPLTSGVCSMAITLNAAPIASSPFTVMVSSGDANANNSIVSGNALNGGVAGVTTSVTVNAVDAQGNNVTQAGSEFNISVTDSNNSLVSSVLSDNGDGSHTSEFTPTLSGTHTIDIKLSSVGGVDVVFYTDLAMTLVFDTHIASTINYTWGSSPALQGLPADKFSVRWSGQIRPPYSEVFKFTTSIFANSGVRVYVDNTLIIDEWQFFSGTADVFGSIALIKNIFINIVVEFRDDTGPAKLVLMWESESLVKQVIPHTSLYYVHDVASSPIIINISPSTIERSLTFADGEALTSSVSMVVSSFIITAMDVYGNLQTNGGNEDEFIITLDEVYGSASYDAVVSDIGANEGTYNVSFTPIVAGEYVLNVFHNVSGGNIYGSPFRSHIVHVGETSVITSTANGEGLSSSIAGVENTFTMTSFDSGSNSLNIGGDEWTATLSNGSDVIVAQITDNDNGTYTATYNVTVAASYSLTIEVNGIAISTSPYTVIVSAATPQAAKCVVAGTATGIATPAPAVSSNFVVQVFDAFNNVHESASQNFYIALIDTRGEIIRANVSDNDNSGNYTMSFTLPTSGKYTVSVLLAAGLNGVGDGLTGVYYNNRWLQESYVMKRIDPYINFEWGEDLITPSAKDYVSVRWSGYVKPEKAETYTFFVDVDDGARLFVDDVLVIDEWFSSADEYSGVFLVDEAELLYSITLEWRENNSTALARLKWSSANVTKSFVPSSRLFSSAEHIQESPFALVAS